MKKNLFYLFVFLFSASCLSHGLIAKTINPDNNDKSTEVCKLRNFLASSSSFRKKEVKELVDEAFDRTKNKGYSAAKKELLKKVRDYRVTGACFAIDPNLAFIWETQNPDINVVFRDSKGITKSRKYALRFDTVGFKIEASIKLDLIFFTDTDFNFYDSDKVIELGTGIDTNLSCGIGLGLTYIPFLNAAGGIFMVSLPLLFAFPSLSIVTGGTLTPVQ